MRRADGSSTIHHVEHTSRLWVEIETSEDGPSGFVRDEFGRTTPVSGWLELIAAVEAPATPGHTETPPRGEPQ